MSVTGVIWIWGLLLILNPVFSDCGYVIFIPSDFYATLGIKIVEFTISRFRDQDQGDGIWVTGIAFVNQPVINHLY